MLSLRLWTRGSNRLLNAFPQPAHRLRLQFHKLFPILMIEDDGDDVFAIGVHGEALLGKDEQ